MRVKKNLRGPADETLVIEINEHEDPRQYPPWYIQFLQLDDDSKSKIIEGVMEMIRRKKPDTYEFIRKFKCELIGVSPNVAYALPDSRKEDSTVTWIHGFASATLNFWCPAGEFVFQVNPNLKYDDTVLNKLKGNPKQRIGGLTG